jgi:hypothetical protein
MTTDELQAEREHKVLALGRAYLSLAICSKNLCREDDERRSAMQERTQAVNNLVDEIMALDYMISRLGGPTREYMRRHSVPPGEDDVRSDLTAR